MMMLIMPKAMAEDVRVLMVVPKMLGLHADEGIPQLLLPVVTDPKKGAVALRWALEEMERRYQILSEAGVRNIAGYNKLVDGASGQARELLRSNEEKSKKGSAPAKNVLVVDGAEGEREQDPLQRSNRPTPHAPAPHQ